MPDTLSGGRRECHEYSPRPGVLGEGQPRFLKAAASGLRLFSTR
ncbi:hypothetical protein SGLAU_13185 [Streptomyces glaucescens]|uniref:Uncharacterized protein n=1 Tax=Streptomyces glaucescens TaxID=1907 RepID=A0A089X617_STRGA|nr:hypothetical protein SGLAU_13185 [Streptomyces glaucescens]